MFSGVFVAEEVDAGGNNMSGDSTTVDVQTVLQAILNLSLRSYSFTDEAFVLVRSKTSGLDTILLQRQIINISKLSDAGLNHFCCTLNF